MVEVTGLCTSEWKGILSLAIGTVAVKMLSLGIDAVTIRRQQIGTTDGRQKATEENLKTDTIPEVVMAETLVGMTILAAELEREILATLSTDMDY